MTTLSASDVAALRIREARNRHKWRVKDLAERCAKAGVPRLTAAVITNLETRRRPGREISLEEILALAWVLDVPPVQLMTPIGGDEKLEVVPGEEKGPLDAPRWLGDDETVLGPVRAAASGYPGHTEPALRHKSNPLTLVRQVAAVAGIIRFRQQLLELAAERKEYPDSRLYSDETFAMLGLRMMHFLEALDGLGYERPDVADALATLASHGVPATLAEFTDANGEEEPGVESP